MLTVKGFDNKRQCVNMKELHVNSKNLHVMPTVKDCMMC